MEEKGLKEE